MPWQQESAALPELVVYFKAMKPLFAIRVYAASQGATQGDQGRPMWAPLSQARLVCGRRGQPPSSSSSPKGHLPSPNPVIAGLSRLQGSSQKAQTERPLVATQDKGHQEGTGAPSQGGTGETQATPGRPITPDLPLGSICKACKDVRSFVPFGCFGVTAKGAQELFLG